MATPHANFDARCAIGGFFGNVGANIRCAYRNSLPRCSRSGDELQVESPESG
jgi:hypothetical protein